MDPPGEVYRAATCVACQSASNRKSWVRVVPRSDENVECSVPDDGEVQGRTVFSRLATILVEEDAHCPMEIVLDPPVDARRFEEGFGVALFAVFLLDKSKLQTGFNQRGNVIPRCSIRLRTYPPFGGKESTIQGAQYLNTQDKQHFRKGFHVTSVLDCAWVASQVHAE